MDVLLIRDGVVVNCVASESCARLRSYFPDCIAVEQSDAVGVGWLYDGATFTQPAPAPESPPDMRIAPNAFDARFTATEWTAIDAASQGPSALAAGLRRYVHQLNRAVSIDMSTSNVHSGTWRLELAGLIGAGRANEILTAPVKPSERPEGIA